MLLSFDSDTHFQWTHFWSWPLSSSSSISWTLPKNSSLFTSDSTDDWSAKIAQMEAEIYRLNSSNKVGSEFLTLMENQLFLNASIQNSLLSSSSYFQKLNLESENLKASNMALMVQVNENGSRLKLLQSLYTTSYSMKSMSQLLDEHCSFLGPSFLIRFRNTTKAVEPSCRRGEH